MATGYHLRAKQFQSTHPARGATRGGWQREHQAHEISIHAPREGCDQAGAAGACAAPGDFNPRTPRGVRRTGDLRPNQLMRISIHAPREGCDGPCRWRTPGTAYFNPRTPRGVRPARNTLEGANKRAISIHAPREGCDISISNIALSHSLFQSTHPARGATGSPQGAVHRD